MTDEDKSEAKAKSSYAEKNPSYGEKMRNKLNDERGKAKTKSVKKTKKAKKMRK
jgi:hypothetical protein